MTNKTIGSDKMHYSELNCEDGLSKREYFAVMAMQGILANVTTIPNSEGLAYAALCSVISADALINELNKTPTNDTP